jgi:hypothetical protein
MNAEAARHELLAQHERIRKHLAVCSTLAGRLRSGEPLAIELDVALGRLRTEIAEHNANESQVVRWLLEGSPGWGTVLIDRMLEEHVAEHASFWTMLAGSVDEVAGRIDDLIDELDAHMAAEERTFLSPAVLRDEVISRRRGHARV